LLEGRLDPTERARERATGGSPTTDSRDQRENQKKIASERRRKGYRSSWIAIMTLA
jgi:hypothetical protein